MKSEVLGVAGGSGTGKTTVAYGLETAHPEMYRVVSLDNYQRLDKHAEGFPWVDDMSNWDHPDVVDWSRLHDDLTALVMGRTVETEVWRHPLNPDFHKHKKFMPLTLTPRPIIVLEGHLALHANIRPLLDRSVFLDLDAEERIRRRRAARPDKAFSGSTDRYAEQVLIPMHQQHIEPTKAVATDVIDVTNLSAEDVLLAVHAIGTEMLQV